MARITSSKEFPALLKETIKKFPLGEYHLRKGGLYMKHKENGVEEGAVWRPVELDFDSRMGEPVSFMGDPECDFDWIDIVIFEDPIGTHNKFPILHRRVNLTPFYKVGCSA